MATQSLPDVLVIVLDAVRSRDVYSDREGTLDGLPFLSRFGREAAVFPQAVAAASWTLPSVATLVTGLYPWDHGASALGGSYLDAGIPTLAGALRTRGYRTVLFSANNVVGPRTNLAGGFDRCYVADWWEQYLRLRRATPGGTGATVGAPATAGPAGLLAQLRRRGSRKAMRLGFRFPGLLERASTLAQRVRDPERYPSVWVAPWIEPMIRETVRETPRSRPLFCLVHYNDAHEPYYRPGRAPGAPGPDRRVPTVRQDYMRHIEGRWSPTEHELSTLHTLYRAMIRELDRRIETLITTFSEHRDLDRTLVLITADHGQAFGEGDWLFHMSRAEETLLRVPLIVRFPGGAPNGKGKGWTSPVDLVPTVFEMAGLPRPPQMPGVPLQRLFSEERATPVWAVGDGLPLRHLEGIVTLPPERRESIAHRTWLAAYLGGSKMTYELTTGTTDVQRVETAKGSVRGAPEDEYDRMFPYRAEAARLGELLLGAHGGKRSDEVENRLDSWGYGV